jgi:hypothetical protein
VLVALAMVGVLPVNDVIAAFCHAPEHAEEAASADPCGDDCGAGCAEKHCGPLDHHCRCCAASAVLPHDGPTLTHSTQAAAFVAFQPARGPSRTLTPPTRPPIA